ncbi:S53 family peptidase [Rhodoferax sp. GW822-FHT02A01]|uniref:S53 family peptidase n=1 Tax=Rhodoferax sp. GW822-FHT02A01 TaxID=3141537 RepID=UPI00315CB00C
MRFVLSANRPNRNTVMSLWALALSTLAACGGGSGTSDAQDSGSTASVSVAAQASLGNQLVTPSFHRLPLATTPSDEDADGSNRSLTHSPVNIYTPQDLKDLGTRGVTDEDVSRFQREHGLGSGQGGATPNSTTTSSIVYTPAQIRAAYQIPNSTNANLGAGQTIYIVDAYSHPKVVQDLTSFSKQFGLPVCSQASLSTSASTLPAASTNSCQIYVLSINSQGNMTGNSPAYNAGWAQEIALDTQWAHAIAPLARIVLIQAPSASLNDLGNAIKLANKFGKGTVSMSFAAAEASWVTNSAYSSSLFGTAGMGYFAATGDSGYAVNWPAIEPAVTAVGGTSLSSFTTSSRQESVWSGTGGGVSSYLAMPAYQKTYASIPGDTSFRASADVSMVADPYTGVYVAFTAATSSTTYWYAFGGTSLSTPIWAALTTVANANRALSGKATLGDAHSLLYSTLASGSYVTYFNDVASGSNGTCTACFANALYDVPTGLGTPNSTAIVSALAAY